VFADFKKFVIAYDFSTSAETTLEYALDLAAKQNAEIILRIVRQERIGRQHKTFLRTSACKARAPAIRQLTCDS
jgi:nucleotide-binding universal stress UspA family protein